MRESRHIPRIKGLGEDAESVGHRGRGERSQKKRVGVHNYYFIVLSLAVISCEVDE